MHHLTHPKYRPDIDGLRAIAVLSVVGFHAFPGWVPGGFVGVDVFFVISGFLISSIVFGNLERGTFSFAEFYARRISRIFPALILVLAATWAFGWYVLLTDEYRQFGTHVAAGAGFMSNFVLWTEAGYFDSAADSKPLLHLWSLAIEEQFYIIWPLLLYFVWKWKANFLAITLLIAAVSFATNIWTVIHHPVAAFYWPISRFWELMIGGVLAYLTLHRPHYFERPANWQSLVGLLLITIGVAILTEQSAFPGAWALLPTVGAYLVISAGPRAWLNRYLLGNRALVWVGLISYPLYLWHWPLLSIVRIAEGGQASPQIRLAMVLASFMLAWLTYALVERKIRHLRGNTSVIALASLAGIVLTAGLFMSTGKFEPRHRGRDLELLVQATEDWVHPAGLFEAREIDGQTYYVAHGSADNVLFFGDSHIQQYGPRVDKLQRDDPTRHKSVIFATTGGCMPIPGVFEDQHPECKDWVHDSIASAKSDHIESVVIGACWYCYFIDMANPMDPESASRGGPASYDYYYLDNGDKKYFRTGDGIPLALVALEYVLAELAQTKPVYLLLDNPNGGAYHPRNFFEGTRLTSLVYKESPEVHRVTDQQRQIRDQLTAVAQRAGAAIIDPLTHLCNTDHTCPTTLEDGSPLYKDSNHLRRLYAEKHASFIDVALETGS